MILKALKYTRYTGNIREWSIVGNNDDYAYFDNINLLVGKNASGKSRTLNVIRVIAGLLSGQISLTDTSCPTEKFELVFHDGKNKYDYFLEYEDREIRNESLYQNGHLVFDRIKKKLHDMDGNIQQWPDLKDNGLIITLSKDDGSSFYPSFVRWGQTLKNYLFSNQIEKNSLVKDYINIEKGNYDVKDVSILIYTFYIGKRTFGESFITEIKDCMHQLGYDQISNIDIQKNKDGYGICAEEYGQYFVMQREMSQGMFRALALFIMLIYAKMSNTSLCILVDDMGEGLDFERSTGIIDIVIKEIHNSNIQFFMTTNDRHIMNKIPLRFWTVIDRERSKSVLYDYPNSKEVFEDFKYTGLSNFDFLATDFYSKGFGTIEEESEN